MIIGLVGQKKSGKDAIGAYLVKEHGFQRRAFADPMKKAIAGMLDIPYWEIDKLKNDPTAMVTSGYKTSNPVDKSLLGETTLMVPDHMWSPMREQTFREFIQRFAESFKPIMGEDVWANLTLPVGGYYEGRAIVVTDVRFTVEAERIRELGGKLIKVIRPQVVDKDPHRSEVEQAEIRCDYTIVNNSTLESLYKEIEIALENICSGT